MVTVTLMKKQIVKTVRCVAIKGKHHINTPTIILDFKVVNVEDNYQTNKIYISYFYPKHKL